MHSKEKASTRDENKDKQLRKEEKKIRKKRDNIETRKKIESKEARV